MFGWGRPRRDLPEVNYAESSESEEDLEEGLDFDSPLTSPQRPLPTQEGSPVLLAVPTLNDNVDEELKAVSRELQARVQVEEEIDDLTDDLECLETKVSKEGKVRSGNHLTPAGNSTSPAEEVFVEGLVVGESQQPGLDMPDDGNQDGDGHQPAVRINFDTDNKQDGDKAAEHARHIKVEFDVGDIRFWFSQLGDEMLMSGIGTQWLKRSVLQRNLPVKQKEDVKALLTLQQVDAGPAIYLSIKTELLRIYAPKAKDSWCKALQRTMTGLPSQLGYKLVNDICKKPVRLSGCCCAGGVNALWQLQLPVGIQYNMLEVFESADRVYLSARQISVAALSVSGAEGNSLDETQAAFMSQNQPVQVAAVSQRGGRGGGASGRGGQSNRGRNKNRGQGRNNGAGNKPRGPRHSSNPPESCCDCHYVHGADAWYCVQPLTCPWASKVTAKQ